MNIPVGKRDFEPWFAFKYMQIKIIPIRKPLQIAFRNCAGFCVDIFT